MKKMTIGRLFLMAAALFCAAAPQALAVTAEEEAAHFERMAAMEPQQPEGTAVLPLIEIEKTWDIEDTHAQAALPLVTSMSFARGEMGTDAASRTFYATIGTGVTEWPELVMTACGADGLNVAWVDDYSWDDPAAAVSGGTSYTLIAWTETEYEYVSLVFTGLPMVILRTGDGALPGDEYGPAAVQVTSAEYDAVSSVAQVHKRGAGLMKTDKDSYRIEFAQRKKKKAGYKKRSISLLGMPEDTDWILLANPVDLTHLSNYMAFHLWEDVNADTPAFNMLESRMVELCINGEYWGVYQLIQRIKPKDELQRMGFSKADTAARIISGSSAEQRPVYRYEEIGKTLELRHQPEGKTAEECFALYDDFVKMIARMTDRETFDALAASHLDLRQLMRFFLFHQSAIMATDNVSNNVYIWAVQTEGRLVYYFSPWDMDRGFDYATLKKHPLNENMNIPVRLLDEDYPGARQALWDEWAIQRSGPLSDSTVGDRMSELGEEMQRTGAWQRDADCWNTPNGTVNLGEERDALIEHLSELEEEMQRRWPLAEAEGTES